MGLFDTNWGATAESAREAFLLAGGAGAEDAHYVPAGWERLSAAELGFSGGLFAGTMDADGFFHGGIQWFGDPEAAVYRNGDRVAVTFRGADDALGDGADLAFLIGDVYLNAFNALLEAVADYVAAEAITDVIVTGASLGGAVSNMLRDASQSRYGGAFANADFYAIASPVIADRSDILNFGYDNDWIFKSFERILGAGDGPFDSATDNVIYFDSDYASRDWSATSTSSHSAEAFADGGERIVESAFYDEMTQDSLVLISATRIVDYNRLEGRTDAFGEGAFILGRDASDRIFGGPGDDRIETLAVRDVVRARGGDDYVLAGTGRDVVYGQTGNDTLMGEGGADQLFGNNGNDRLFGGGGPDVLDGGNGRDTLDGGPGADVLDSGAGPDAMTGGGGADVFHWSTGDGSDTITDLQPVDVIDLAGQALLTSFADVLAAASVVDGTDTVITAGAETLTLLDTLPGDLSAANFEFAIA